MQSRNLGWKTDLMFLRWLGEEHIHDGFTVYRTPSNPTFHWGNFVYFHQPPGPGDARQWRAIFASHFPGVAYEAIAWESEEPLADNFGEFVDCGLTCEVASVMSTRELQPPRHPRSDLSIRPFESDEDWESRVELQVRCRGVRYSEDGYREFASASGRNYRVLQSQGKGAWFGAFLDDQLVADCGLFHEESVGRFQSVGTHPDFRRKGICQNLVHSVARIGLEQWGLRDLFIVAEDGQPAGRIYSSLGFGVTEKQVTLYRAT